MSDPVTPLGLARAEGFAAIAEIGPLGMITLRAKPDTPGLGAAVQAAMGLALPEQRRILTEGGPTEGGRAIGWMSPDEWLLILPRAEVPATLGRLREELAGRHHLAADISDARAVFRIEGPKASEVLMKLAPVDHQTLAPGELRRSRAAQVACAFWRDDAGYVLVCFRSVAAYVMGLLTHSAMPGSELSSDPVQQP